MTKILILILIITIFSIGGNADNSNVDNNIVDYNSRDNHSLDNNALEDIANNDTNNIDETVQYKDTKVSIKTKNLGKDVNWNAQKVLVNITVNRLGNLTYLEEYFSVDSQMQPKFYSSKIHYESKLTKGNVSFEILRPRKNRKTFILTKGIIILDGNRIYERWITSNISNYIIVDKIDKKNKSINKVNDTDKIIDNDTHNNDTNDEGINTNINNNDPVNPNDNEIKRIFQINNTSTSKKTSGTGIGITIVILIICSLYKKRRQIKRKR